MTSLKIISRLLVLFIATTSAAYAQQQFTHTVTAANKYCNSTCSTTNISSPFAIIIVSPILVNGTNRNPHPVGVFYVDDLKKWSIINVDGTALTEGVKFNVQYYLDPDPNQFVFLVTKQGGTPCIDHVGLNAKPNAQVLFSPTGSPRGAYFNKHYAKIEYDAAARQWCIVNINDEPVNQYTAFNIVVTSGVANHDPNRDPAKVTVPAETPPVIRPLEPIVLGNIPKPGNQGKVTVPPSLTPPVVQPIRPVPNAPKQPSTNPVRDWILREELPPTIGPNSDIILFIHGMDSRAEEADDITKALFEVKANPTGSPASPPPTGSTTPDPLVKAALQRTLQKYEGCIREKYETQADMVARHLNANLSSLWTTTDLQNRDLVACVAGNMCSLAFRRSTFDTLQAQANRGDPTDFEMKLTRAIPTDCFECSKHLERHTKHVHCTMEAGGNSGLKGPYFEGCKAGVDAAKLITDIINDLHTAMSVIGTAPAPGQMIGGPTIATNYKTVKFNSCANPSEGCPETCDHNDDFSNGARKGVLPEDSEGGQRVTLYFEPLIPKSMLDGGLLPNPQFNSPAGRNIGANEGRLRKELRDAAANHTPLASLRLAAYEYAGGDPVLAQAYADLSVTGRRAFRDFENVKPNESFCQEVTAARQPRLAASGVLEGCGRALDRAYKVANFLRTGQRGDSPAEKTRKTAERNALQWIAVSGEDDSPHRPVNVPSSDYPQYDLDVFVPALQPSNGKIVKVHTRYTIAQSEVVNVGKPGKNLVIISLDLPTSGYSENLDYDVVSPLADIGQPKWTPLPVPIVVPSELLYFIPGMPILPPGFTIPPGTPLPDFQATGRTPLLDFIENFIVSFAETLDQKKIPVKNNFKAVMGGSLGGNMTFRLGRRTDVPFPNFIVWSPASIWSSLGDSSDILKHFGPRSAYEGADRANIAPNIGDRAAFFGGWDKPVLPLVIPMAQSDTWTSDYYQCKKSSVAAARLDRHETYDANFLSWHWRLGGEQLLFSHQNRDPATNQPLFKLNKKPMLLACGLEDRVAFNDICPATMNTAPLMTETPGKALFLEKTGHSLDNERRKYWARQIVEFLGL